MDSRNEIPETYLEEGGDAEVDRVQIVPVFPLGEEDGADQQVDGHHPQAGRRWDQHLKQSCYCCEID